MGMCLDVLYIQLIHRDSDDAVHCHMVHLDFSQTDDADEALCQSLMFKNHALYSPGIQRDKDRMCCYTARDSGVGCMRQLLCYGWRKTWQLFYIIYRSFILLFLLICTFVCAAYTFVFPDPSIQCLSWKYRMFYSWFFEKTCHESFRVARAVCFNTLTLKHKDMQRDDFLCEEAGIWWAQSD